MTRPDQWKLHRNLLIGLAGFAVIVLVLVATMRLGLGARLTGSARILVGTAGATLLVLWWGVFGLRIARAQDEYQRWMEHRTWYVGGLAGLLVSVPVYTFVGLGGLHWLNLATDPQPAAGGAFTGGYMLAVMMQVAGATAYGVWSRFARR